MTLRELWEKLRLETVSKRTGVTSMLLRISASGVRLYAGLDTDSGLPELVLEIPQNIALKDIAHIGSRAFDVHVGSRSGFSAGSSAISLVLKASEFEDLFGILGEDIVLALETVKDESAAVNAVIRRIERWRKFIERNRGWLSEEEVRGLIGELAVLGRLINHAGAHDALDSWQESGGLRDFELAGYAIEVKTHQMATGATVRISDPAQLEFTSERPLYLATIQLSRVENAGWTLAEAVSRLMMLLAGDVNAIGKLRDSLMNQGYLDVHADMYPQRYIVDRIQLHRVDEGFPRIACDAVPAGVEAVQFSIQLAAIQQFIILADGILGSYTLLEVQP